MAIHDANGDSTVITRLPDGTPTSIVAPRGEVTTLGLANGFLRTVTNPANEAVTLDAGTDGLLREITDAEARKHTLVYDDADGRLASEEDPAGGTQAVGVSYAGTSRTITRSTGMGRSSTYVLTDSLDGTRQLRITGPSGHLTYRSDSSDARLKTWTPEGLLVIDSLGREPRYGMFTPMTVSIREQLPSGIVRTVEPTHVYTPAATGAQGYNPPFQHGTMTRYLETNDRPPASAEFNSANARLTLTSSESRITVVTVDSVGRVLAVAVAELDTIRVHYDRLGRDSLVAQGNRGVRFGYDALGRLAEVRDTSGRMSVFSYDGAGRPTSLALPGGRSLVLGYDHAGNLTAFTPPGRPTHGLDHTPVDLLRRYRPPTLGMPASLTEYVYNGDQQLTHVKRPDSTNVQLTYDGSTGRLASLVTPRGTSTFHYQSSTVQRDSLTSPDGVTLHYGYDGPIATSETWTGAVNGSVSMTLDRDFRVSTQSVNSAQTVAYGYDDDGLLTQAGSLTVTRNPANGLVTGTALGTVTTSASANGFGEPEVVAALAGTDTLWRAVYARDPLGRIVGIAEKTLGVSEVRGYAYSDTGFLVAVTVNGTLTERYGYDGNGNRTRAEGPGVAASGNYDDQDRLTSYTGATYTYTAAGELKEKIVGTDTTRYSYDPLGNLIRVVVPNTEVPVTADTITYEVDGRNRRVGRKVNGAVTQRWLYQDQLEPVAELDGAGSVVARYVYGTRSHVPDYVVKGGVTYRIVSDHLGSVRLVVNAATGVVVQRMDYDGYGRLTGDTNPGFQCFGYAGGLWDEATGLVRFGSRDYEPNVGRWTSRDPLGLVGDEANQYVYVVNQPTLLVDPAGQAPIDLPPSGIDQAASAVLKESLFDPTAAFADGIIPIYDPFASANMYQITDANGLCWSRTIGISTRNVELALLLPRLRFRAGFHETPHPFGALGRQPHFQFNWWIKGVRGSGVAWRLPWPW